MEKSVRQKLKETKYEISNAEHLRGLFTYSIHRVYDIQETLKNRNQLDDELNGLLDKLLKSLQQGNTEASFDLDTAKSLYISAFEEFADEEDMFYTDDSGTISFPDEEEPDEE